MHFLAIVAEGKPLFLALGKTASPKSLKLSALIGVDPVDGMLKGKQTPPKVLTYDPNSFDLEMAVLVIGSGLGEVRKNPLFLPCAPKGVNHEDFYKECRKLACHFVAKDYGHVDMLDDDTKGIRGKSSYYLCKNGKSREPMRSFVGGVVVAFLRAYLEGDFSDLVGIRYGHEKVPLELQKVEFVDCMKLGYRRRENLLLEDEDLVTITSFSVLRLVLYSYLLIASEMMKRICDKLVI
ncbi:hypothetical protein RHMOL_Rhmol02G0030300 [Rhododendron molle]|uniref:Uncharacterized protein n=1 Tax=Rhododendron molle TaxID=49168 RepID=A0ACC0PL28_RHOML|nr:hypothetical protein RHMOL_Rhmol02G0030300 [Rhododendron molle]